MQGKFMVACFEGDDDIVKDLIPHVSVNVNGFYQGYTALYHAACQGDLILVNTLLENKADPDLLIEDKSSSPLLIAASKGYVQIVKALLVGRANANIANHEGNTPLHCAIRPGTFNCQSEYQQTIKLLLIHGANPTLENLKAESPISLATASNKDILRKLHQDAVFSKGMSECFREDSRLRISSIFNLRKMQALIEDFEQLEIQTNTQAADMLSIKPPKFRLS